VHYPAIPGGAFGSGEQAQKLLNVAAFEIATSKKPSPTMLLVELDPYL